MSPDREGFGPLLVKSGEFTTTQWSVVLEAGRGDSPEATAALEKLCGTYWYPIYCFVRRKGYTPEEAEDLTQGFFALLISRRDLEAVRRERGRFRSYLLVALDHFLVNDWKRGQTQKRGGGHAVVPLDRVLAEDLYGREPADRQTPETAFEKRWALTVLDKVLAQLEAEYVSSGRTALFNALRDFLATGSDPRPQAEIAIELGITEAAAKQAVHRLRSRYRELLREEISQTVATLGDVEDEVRHLISALRS